MGLKDLGFTQMQVCNEKFTPFRTPESLFRKKLEALLLLDPGDALPIAPRAAVSEWAQL